MAAVSDKIIVNKLQAARDQVRAAIFLWAQNDNPVAVHTLVAAAHEIVHILYKQAGLHDLLFDSDLITDEGLPVWRKLLKERANFFKHADRDPDATIEMDPDQNEFYILFTLVGLRRMKLELTVEEQAFGHWLAVHRPNLMKKDIIGQKIPPEMLKLLRGLSRQQFLDYFVALHRHPSGSRQPAPES